jgi:hypothetical protein
LEDQSPRPALGKKLENLSEEKNKAKLALGEVAQVIEHLLSIAIMWP